MLPVAGGLAATKGASLAKKALQKKKGSSSRKKTASGTYRRRRRARLTQGDLNELTMIKNILGKTAASNALPFYMGRGRG